MSPLAARLRALAARPEAALFVLGLGTYAYFFQAGGWNQNSRFDLVRAIVEQRRLTIDDYVGNTGDYAFFRGHHYCDKAPGLSLLAVPVYAAVFPFAGGERPRGRLIHLGAYLSTVVTVGLPSAAALALVFRTAVSLGTPAAWAALAALAYGFATLAFPYATLFYAHQLAGALLAGAFFLLVDGQRRDRLTPLRLAAAGACLGYAIASEYPAALPAAVIGGYALAVVRPKTRVLWLCAGAALPLVGLAVYHAVSFGHPLTLPYTGAADPNRQGGLWLGVRAPDPAIVARVLFSTERGLLHHTPWLALAVPGLVRMLRDQRLRREGITCLFAIVVGLAFNGALRGPNDWRGGAGVGTRYLVPWLPFYAIATAALMASPAPRWARRRTVRLAFLAVVLALVALSGWRMLLATAIRPEIQHKDDPMAEYARLWEEDQVAISTVPFHSGNLDPKYAWNLGERAGLEGRASLMPLAAFAALASVWLAAALRRSGAADGHRQV